MAAPSPCGQDRPRSRGVYTSGSRCSLENHGSSPLARGLHLSHLLGLARDGIIPARAGFTIVSVLSGLRGWDHPRSRGVYSRSSWTYSPWWGSSPLARGLPAANAADEGFDGIIPARAGFTREAPHRGGKLEDHPRSRGVYEPLVNLICCWPGSSPLARGLLLVGLVGVLGGRIIPARAGFTESCGATGCPQADHPRSRGVYHLRRLGEPRRAGSSPLARGLRCRSGARLGRNRIIPARAGFTGSPRCGRLGGPDHPRSRGVYLAREAFEPLNRGSSPLARGLHLDLLGGLVVDGIIPARAGFTDRRPGCPVAPEDHPRSRGVYTCAPTRAAMRSGSSPLARGLPGGGVVGVLDGGIIPARAGFTRAPPPGRRCDPDHPRSRGVYQGTCGRVSLVGRIIPARAGFTARRPARRPRGRDHPRSRGVYAYRVMTGLLGVGSSPLARGLPTLEIRHEITDRIIPARAGFTP